MRVAGRGRSKPSRRRSLLSFHFSDHLGAGTLVALLTLTAHGILRVIAFILLCIGIQIVWNGLSALLATVIPR
jgi:small neutral amino acid transporter SnatA (MarC family)